MGVFEHLEKLRKLLIFLSILLTLLLVAGMAMFFLAANQQIHPALCLLAVIPAVACAAAVALFISRYKTYYKNHMVSAVLNSYFEDLIYQPDGGLEEAVIEETGMIRMGDTYSSEDYVAGQYKGVAFEMADVLIQEKLVSPHISPAASTLTHFEGRWLIFTFERAFRYDLLVKEKSLLHAQRVGNTDHPSLERVSVANEALNRFFRVYAAGEREAAYMLNPFVCEALLHLNREIKGDLIFGFIGNRLHVAIHGIGDAFEPKILSRLDRGEIEGAVYSDIRAIIDFIDRLKPDERLFRNASSMEEDSMKQERGV